MLRHTAAMDLLRHGVDRSVIALWLGHESVDTTQMYLHADIVIFQKHDPTFFINMTPGSKAYPRINTTTFLDP